MGWKMARFNWHRLSEGERNRQAKLTSEQVKAIRQRSESGETTRELAEDYGMSVVQISRIVRRTAWKHL